MIGLIPGVTWVGIAGMVYICFGVMTFVFSEKYLGHNKCLTKSH